jgi:3-dehydroquinate synthase
LKTLEPITVSLLDRSYDIEVGAGTLDGIGERLAALTPSRRVGLVTQPPVDHCYGSRVEAALAGAGFSVVKLVFPDGEDHKNLEEFGRLLEALADARLERSSLLIALGGGVVGDLTGFVAASYLRGIDVVQVPTTLLAQVDSSIGGKTGVNLPSGKNLVGAFHQPRLVLADVETLTSLDEREYRAGLAEVVKYGMILSPELFDSIERRAAAIVARDPEVLGEVIHRCAESKARVVMEDEREGSLRAILNFGHTLGHAIESVTRYRRFLHGEAVGIGMVFAARLSSQYAGFPRPDVDRLRSLLESLGLPTEIPAELDPSSLARAAETDKKRQADRVKFVCVEAVGRTRFEMLSTEEIEAVVRSA